MTVHGLKMFKNHVLYAEVPVFIPNSYGSQLEAGPGRKGFQRRMHGVSWGVGFASFHYPQL